MDGPSISLREHFDIRLADYKESVDQRFGDQDKAVGAALNAAQVAVDKAEQDRKAWQAQSNEWRGALNDRSSEYLTRREAYILMGTFIVFGGFLLTILGFALSHKAM